MLEILIAIFLASLCLTPLIRSPIEGYRAEMHLLEEMEGERLLEWSFSEIREMFLNREIPWDKIPAKGGGAVLYNLPPVTIEIPGAKPKKIERSFTFYCKGEKEGKEKEIYKILYIDILFSPALSQKKKPDKNPYRLVIQKIPV